MMRPQPAEARRRVFGPVLDGKIRQGILDWIPYLAIVGEEEARDGSVALRHKGKGDLGKMPTAALAEKLFSESGV